MLTTHEYAVAFIYSNILDGEILVVEGKVVLRSEALPLIPISHIQDRVLKASALLCSL